MSKKFLGTHFVLFALLVFLISSCSSFESSDGIASLSFRISGELAQKIKSESSRQATPNNENLYLEISVKGDFEAKKTLKFAEGEEAEFKKVPVGAEVYAFVQVFEIEPSETPDPNAEPLLRYEGMSSPVTVKSGENRLQVSLKHVYPGNASFDVEFSESDGSDIAVVVTVNDVKVNDEESGGSGVVLLDSGSTIKFSAEQGYDSYEWTVNGETRENSESPYELELSGAELFAKSGDGKIVIDIALLATKTDDSGTAYHSYAVQITNSN